MNFSTCSEIRKLNFTWLQKLNFTCRSDTVISRYSLSSSSSSPSSEVPPPSPPLLLPEKPRVRKQGFLPTVYIEIGIIFRSDVQIRESVVQTRLWSLRPDGLAFRLSTKTKAGMFCILEFKRMSDGTDQYLIRARSRAENQYASLRRALG